MNINEIYNGTTWSFVKKAIHNLQSEIYLSIRIPLYMLLHRRFKNSCIYNAGKVYKCLKYLFATNRRSSQKLNAEGKILFILPHRTPSHVNNILPVIKEVERRKISHVILCTDDFTNDHLPRNSFSEIVNYNEVLLSIRKVLKIFALVKSVAIFVKLLFCFCKMNISCVILLLHNYGYMFEYIFLSYCARYGFGGYIRKSRPAFVLSTSDFWPIEHQIFSLANSMSIPAAVIQHGVINEYWWPFIARYDFLWGELFKKQLLKMGADENRLVVTGMPASDHLFSKSETTVKEPGKITCLVLSQTTAQFFKPISVLYRKIFRGLIQRFPNIDFTVKLHPIENESFYSETNLKVNILPKETKVVDAINNATICCTLYSTAGLEAMIMKKPLIVLSLSDVIAEFAWWPEYGGGMAVKNLEEATVAMENLISSQPFMDDLVSKQSVFIEKCFHNRGNASRKIVDTITDMMLQ